MISASLSASFSASLLLTSAFVLGPPDSDRSTPVLTPTQRPGERAIAPAVIDGERASPEPISAEPAAADPVEPSPVEPSPVAEEPGDTLPTWEGAGDPAGDPTRDPAGDTPIADWTTPDDPVPLVPPPRPEGPAKGWGLIGAAGGVFGGMVLTQLITGLTCDDVYCGTRGWPWRGLGLASVALAGGGGWVRGNRVAWDQAQAGTPARNPIGRRAGGWAMFVVGLGGMIADTALYQLCYDGAKGPYFQLEGFRYTCSPVLSVVTLDLSTLLTGAGLGLALSAESQLRNRPKFDLSVSPWGGRGQAGLSIGGRF